MSVDTEQLRETWHMCADDRCRRDRREAADELERLYAETQRLTEQVRVLRERLDRMCRAVEYGPGENAPGWAGDAYNEARAALAATEES